LNSRFVYAAYINTPFPAFQYSNIMKR